MIQGLETGDEDVPRVLCRADRRDLISHMGLQPQRLAANDSVPKKRVSEPLKAVGGRLYDWFDRVVVINLDRRQDRWERMQRHLAENGWPFRWPQRFRAVDGRSVKPPVWWRVGAGAWGCHQSHVRVLEQALMDGVESLLVLEDDACLTSDFGERIGPFLRSLPGDWDQAYLGGQHLFQKQNPPVPINAHVSSVFNVNRTHAYAVARLFMSPLYRHLNNYLEHAKYPNHHVDHRMGVLHQQGEHGVYAPEQWLIGQARSHSNIKGKVMPQRYWNGAKRKQRGDVSLGNTDGGQYVAVVGPYRSGTSCLAGVLHHLGGCVGSDNRRGNHNNPKGFFESISLARRCRSLYREPSLRTQSTQERRIQVLREWKASRSQTHCESSAFKVAKHPLLCMLCNEMTEAWGDETKFIGVYRPIDDSFASLNRAGWWRHSQRRSVLEALWQAREEGLAERPHLRLDYYDLLAAPAREIDRIIAHLKIHPTEQQRADAVAFVEPSLNHFAKGGVA